MIKLSSAIQHSLHYPLILSSLTALGIALLLLFCLLVACIVVSSFITFVIYIQMVAYEARIRNRLQTPGTINGLSEVGDNGLVLNVQVLERLLPSVTISEDDKHQLNSGECSICLDEYVVGESCRRFPVCKHMFHSSCIDHWLQNHITCPVCRQCIYNL
ncbi:Arabidopsis Toxicos en Levadura 19 [Hibiscus trionum]|uniref:RING-type E3 ubiquitin transferase n=1 Tax=Hibiscus trionum TaxID=183268 RepID=A0A9W7GTF1_HIBTR|nr:Arabidopsis Toxicos en Levadura 19 [Hibiscus trionum]